MQKRLSALPGSWFQHKGAGILINSDPNRQLLTKNYSESDSEAFSASVSACCTSSALTVAVPG